ncbi:Gfo/Idh/MocA family oxidoreductase [Jinshanibacter sp. LJY008]|uniref:Gfo/Idh/MocA family oxidoreductase n=1 Tax=Limnobaculum eriocheiris TaxID=2897391 RepID=A0A9X1SKH4_9GAMM|nr:Gfo/Idh/MocA family oxidoreductase [Limnobaculum eriocheiris]MCD1125675.1 Gfo/Idh/MocA family oxidoreductase [Limnobaculum eriocheiris]
MSQLRIGVAGLGGIAQKAYLPILSRSENWALVGAFSPNQQKAKVICDSYRISCFSSLSELARHCDAVLVHSSTASHFQVVSELLKLGVHVYVDKPLAETLEQSEQLIELAHRQQKTLMVGFNRRFAPLYQQLKQHMAQACSLRMDKHRTNSVGPNDVRFTMLDDYLHVVDTALWLAGQDAKLMSEQLQVNQEKQMLYAEHHFRCGNLIVTTSMHRQAGSQRESVQAIASGAVFQVDDMRRWQNESAQGIIELPAPGWQTTLEQRGFDGAIRHFIDTVSNQTQAETSGEQAIYAQRIVEQLLQSCGE